MTDSDIIILALSIAFGVLAFMVLALYLVVGDLAKQLRIAEGKIMDLEPVEPVRFAKPDGETN